MSIDKLIPQNTAAEKGAHTENINARVSYTVASWIKEIAKKKNQSVAFVAGKLLEDWYREWSKPRIRDGESE